MVFSYELFDCERFYYGYELPRFVFPCSLLEKTSDGSPAKLLSLLVPDFGIFECGKIENGEREEKYF